jgi:hypothetical protein
MTQVELFTLAMEDAIHNKAPIYTMQVDFTGAFNTISQSKLIAIMRELGFPPDLLENVVELYRDATTTYGTDVGNTEPVEVLRGTMQGDTLSPFLFDIYMEPLLRWLQHGGRGYRFRCSSTAHTLSATSYADDLQTLTDNVPNMHVQASKLTAFSDWGGLTC